MAEQFGKYLLERKIAVGGMAEIFLATQAGPEGFEKRVAIKRILPHLTEDQDFVTMFLDEARLVARFTHPNLVQIFELGQVAENFFVAMEFVNGLSTSKLLKECARKKVRLPLEYGAKIVSFADEGISLEQINFFEYHDAYTIYATLSLEAAGFAPRGAGWKLAGDGSVRLTGRIPCGTQGGLKARGNPGGATGVYQAVEAALQLRGQAGANQVAGAKYALIQSLGGPASVAVSHILEGVEV